MNPKRTKTTKLTIEDLAKIQGVSTRTIRNWMTSKHIPYLKIRGVLRFQLEEVEEALDRFKMNTKGSELAEVHRLN